MNLDPFNFPIPDHLIAHTPLTERDAAKILVYKNAQIIRETIVSCLPDLLTEGTLLIANDSRVFPARLKARTETGGQMEIFLLKEIDQTESESQWEVLGRPLKKLKPGMKLFFPSLTATVSSRAMEVSPGTRSACVTFNCSSQHLQNWLPENAYVPLPPYIDRSQPEVASNSVDFARYQTVYAGERGSVAAPTAGLHVTETLKSNLKTKGIDWQTVTLHVGAGTFLPVKTENITEHKLHAERYFIGRELAQLVVNAKKDGRPVVAIGTTTFRALESLHRLSGSCEQQFVELADAWHETDLFIHPTAEHERYTPWCVDGLMTNFHQPCSSLLMLICALIGINNARMVYDHAVREGYRFYSYGDTSLLWLR